MKKITLLILFIFSPLCIFAQMDLKNGVLIHNNSSGEKIFPLENIEVGPIFTGGDSLLKFVGQKFVPQDVEGLNVNFIVSFVVEIDGTVSDIITVPQIDAIIKSEIDRVVLLTSGQWRSATKESKKVRCQYNFPMAVSN